jgi:hypothetical protein
VLRQHVRHADDEAHRPARRTVLHGVEQLAPQAEDLVGIAIDRAAHVGELEPAADALEELLVERVLQRADLRADGRRREAELVARAADAALACGEPEVEEVVVVQPLHAAKGYFVNTEWSRRYFLFARIVIRPHHDARATRT